MNRFAEVVRERLEARERVRAHYRAGRDELVREVHDVAETPAGTFALEVFFPAVTWYVDPARLYDLPLPLAREIAELGPPEDRETHGLHDGLQRALRRPWLFAGAAYAPFSWETPERAASTERKLAEWPNADAPHHFPRPGWQERIPTGRPEHPGYRATLAELGMRLDDEGRYRVTPPDEHGLDPWLERLRALEGGVPENLNGVPVTRLPCSPMRFRVGRYELTANVGLGTGGRDRRTDVLTLREAAARVRSGRFPHFRCDRSGNWRETQ